LITMRALPLGVDRRTILMTAAKSDQFAGPLPGGFRPAFSYLALGALRGWAADARGDVTASGLVDYVRRVLSLSRDRTQTPELSTPETAAVVLGNGRESGPDLAKLQRATAAFSGRGFRAPNIPAAPAQAAKALARATPAMAAIQWVRIPGGKFTMGSSGGRADAHPPHEVTVNSFQIAKTLVTNKQYKACVAAGSCTALHLSDGTCRVYDGSKWDMGSLPESFQGDDQPAVCVDWNQAQVFAQWAGGRLPTEAEWEYAARSAGKDQKYPWGDEAATCERAIINDGVLAPGCGRISTGPVCSKPAGNTRQGLCDMAGNAWEWMEDWYHPSYSGAPADGSAWVDAGSARVVRGASWYDAAGIVVSAMRSSSSQIGREGYMGFRLAR
jgi:formylglycine-generating enzyme required for sulfatase activity